MKVLPFYLFLLFSFAFSQQAGAQIFQLYELDQFRKKGDVESIMINNGDIAEINSTLVIRIDKDAIGREIGNFGGEAPVDSREIKKLNALLENQEEMTKMLTEQVEEPNFKGLANLADQIIPFYMEIAQDPYLNTIFNEADSIYSSRFVKMNLVDELGALSNYDAFIINYFNDKTQEIARNVNASLSEENVKFLLSGFLRPTRGAAREISLSDEFDLITPDYYEVPRWQLTLTQADKSELTKMTGFADNLKALRNQGEQRIQQILKEPYQSEDCLKNLSATLKTVTDQASTLIPELGDQVRNQLLRPRGLAGDLVFKFTQDKQIGNQLSNVALLNSFNDELVSTKNGIDSLIFNMDRSMANIIAEAPTEPVILNLKSTYDGCRSNFEADKQRILGIVGGVKNFIVEASQTIQVVEQISDKVKRLGFDLIPEESFVDLRSTGFRRNGDRIVIKAAIAKEMGDQEIIKVIDQRLFTIQQIGVYSVVKPVLVLANPFDNDSPRIDLQSDFQFAPSYSLLFKFGSRRSNAFNNFWSPGIGINFSATDFNTDGTPEFGASAEFTFIRDYLATGLGYNFGADEPFYYVGFRLPFGAVPLPIFNEVDIQSSNE